MTLFDLLICLAVTLVLHFGLMAFHKARKERREQALRTIRFEQKARMIERDARAYQIMMALTHYSFISQSDPSLCHAVVSEMAERAAQRDYEAHKQAAFERFDRSGDLAL